MSGNANLIAVRILDKLPDEPTCVASYAPLVYIIIIIHSHRRVSYTQGQHMFHCLVASGITFVCMAEEVRLPRPRD